MTVEQGVVTRLGQQGELPMAWVKIERSSACESCSSRRHCNVGQGADAQEVETINTVQARIGDRIQVVMDTGSFLKATFLLYVFPIICMLVGGLLGNAITTGFNFQGSLFSVLLSVFFLAAALLVVRSKGRRMGRDRAYRPYIQRVLGRTPDIESGNRI